MTAKPSNLGSFHYEAETTFAETGTTAATAIEVAAPLDVSGLSRRTMEANFTEQYRGEGQRRVLGPKEGSFTTSHYLTGHGSDPGTGSLTATDLANLIAYCLGTDPSNNLDATGDGATITSGTDADTFEVTATIANDSFVRLGAAADGRGGGLAYWVATYAGTTCELDTATPATVSTDQCAAMLTLFPNTLVASLDDVTGLRCKLATGNKQYITRGTFCESISLNNLAGGQIPKLDLGWRCANWDVVNQTFPDTTATNAKTPAPNTGGDCFFQTHGTTTANYVCVRDFSVNITRDLSIVESSCTDDTDQIISSVKELGYMATVSMTVEVPASGTNTYIDDYEAGNAKHILYTLNPTGGKCVALYFRNCIYTAAPVQVDYNGQNAMRLEFLARPDTGVTTNDRTVAPFAIGMG